MMMLMGANRLPVSAVDKKNKRKPQDSVCYLNPQRQLTLICSAIASMRVMAKQMTP